MCEWSREWRGQQSRLISERICRVCARWFLPRDVRCNASACVVETVHVSVTVVYCIAQNRLN